MGRDRAVVAIVDDDAAVCRALQRLVLSLGHDATSFPSGEALLASIDTVLPTHVLVDLHMPGLHGSALLERIRTRTRVARVIVMTGLETAGAREACLAHGADVFLRKPLKPADLRSLLGAPTDG